MFWEQFYGMLGNDGDGGGELWKGLDGNEQTVVAKLRTHTHTNTNKNTIQYIRVVYNMAPDKTKSQMGNETCDAVMRHARTCTWQSYGCCAQHTQQPTTESVIQSTTHEWTCV